VHVPWRYSILVLIGMISRRGAAVPTEGWRQAATSRVNRLRAEEFDPKLGQGGKRWSAVPEQRIGSDGVVGTSSAGVAGSPEGTKRRLPVRRSFQSWLMDKPAVFLNPNMSISPCGTFSFALTVVSCHSTYSRFGAGWKRTATGLRDYAGIVW
jgi:hypothetical protein